jgi:hypothetical protein
MIGLQIALAFVQHTSAQERVLSNPTNEFPINLAKSSSPEWRDSRAYAAHLPLGKQM